MSRGAKRVAPSPGVQERSPRWRAPRPAVLLDVNTLVALGWAEHEAHAAVVRRLGSNAAWSTCAITQLGFVRISSTSGIFSRSLSPPQAHAALVALCSDAEHAYLADGPPVTACDFGHLAGPRQTTDAYLLALAQHHGMRLLTLDKRLAQAFPGAAFELLGADQGD